VFSVAVNSSPNITRVIKLRYVRWVIHVEYMDKCLYFRLETSREEVRRETENNM